jgi:tol-pal system protein YbgF
MDKRLILLLSLCNPACAELPPVSGNPGTVAPYPTMAQPNQPPPSAVNNYEMIKRFEQLQAEVQQLTGKVEEQGFQIEELKKQQKTMFTDFDDRIQAIENKSGGDGSSITSDNGADSALSPEPSADGASIDKPEAASLDAGAQSPPPTVEPAASVATENTAPQNAPADETQEYQQAYNSLRNGQTSESIEQFNAYIAKYPNGAYASNAHYWLGEAYHVNQDNTAARKAFNEVLLNHSSSAKAPDALLKLGYIEIEEGNKDKAKEYLNRVTTEFSASKAAVLAQKKLLTLDVVTP